MGFGGGGFNPSPNNIAGSTIVGTNKDTDVHQFTGSVDITGSLEINGVQITTNGGGGTPGGANTQVQFNDNGSFGGSANFTFDGSTITVSDDSDIAAKIGRANIGAVVGGGADYAYFSHRDQATSTNFALQQRANGTTVLNAPTGGSLSLRLGHQNCLVVDGARNNNIGINGNPEARLHVSANTNEKDVFRADGDINNILYVSGSGKVGIGTGTPTAALHVSSSTSDPLFRVDHSTQSGAKPILFVTGSGLVGIGTGAPRTDSLDTNRLHILGESGADQGQDPVFNTLLMLENNDHAGIQFMTPINKSGLICWGDADAARVAHFYFDHTSNRFNFDGNAFGTTNVMSIRSAGDSVNIGSTDFDMDGSNEACLHISSSTGGTGVGGPVLLRVDHAEQPGAQPTLFVTGSGRVGIGTDSPSQALDVGGNVSIGGTYGATTTETLTSNGAMSANTSLSILNLTAQSNNTTYAFTIGNGSFTGQEKKIYAMATSGSSGAASNAIQISGTNIRSNGTTAYMLVTGSLVDFGGGPQWTYDSPQAGASMVWDGSKWLIVGNNSFNLSYS